MMIHEEIKFLRKAVADLREVVRLEPQLSTQLFGLAGQIEAQVDQIERQYLSTSPE